MIEKENITLVLSGKDVSAVVQRIGLNKIMDLLISGLRSAIQHTIATNPIPFVRDLTTVVTILV